MSPRILRHRYGVSLGGRRSRLLPLGVGGAILGVAIAALAGCSGPRDQGASGEIPGGEPGGGSEGNAAATGARKITIVAAIAPLASLARMVGGDRAEVITLIPPGASEHTWEPSPRDALRLEKTDVFFKVGLGFEAWAAKVVTASAARFRVVDASAGVDLMAEAHGSDGAARDGPGASTSRGMTGDRAAQESSSERIANPHYWLDPLSMRDGVRRLGEALAEIDTSGAADYRARAARVVSDLDALDAEIRRRTSAFSSREIVTFHAAWDYFARRYGLTIAGEIEEFPGKEPGPRRIGELVGLIRERRIRAIFSEPQYPPKSAEILAAECGIPLRMLDPLGGESVPDRSDYFSLMRYNVRVMEEVLH